MTKHEEEKELDQFWRDLSAEMISDTITLEEADRRMAAAEDDELSDAQIQNIVQRATTRRSSLKPAVESLPRAPRGRIYRFGGFRLTANVAATGVFSALLLSAGVAVMLWPEEEYSSFRYDHATLIAADEKATPRRRLLAVVRIQTQVRFVIKAVKELSAGGGDLAKVADDVILGLLVSLGDPTDLQLNSGTVEKLKPICDAVLDESVPTDRRVELLRRLGEESVFGISSIAHSVGGTPTYVRDAAAHLSRLGDLLRK